MAFTKIAAAGIETSSNLVINNINTAGVITAASIVATTGTFTGNVSIAGTLTYEDVTNIDSVGIVTARSSVIVGAGLSVVGVSTFANTVVVGGATTQLVVNGNARITGILTIGTSSITFDGNTDSVRIGTAVTITSGIVSATEFRGNGINLTSINASNLGSGTIPDARFPATLPAVSGANLTGISPFASGTLMLFQQTSAPTGWTKQTTHDNKALRVVSGSASSGGTTAFTSVFTSRTPTGTLGNTTATGTVGGTTLSTTQIPNHDHGLGVRNGNATLGYTSSADAFGQAGGGGSNMFSNAAGRTSNTAIIDETGGGGSHNHSLSIDAHNHTFSGTAMDFAVQYVDLIIASKD